jgi:malic enzyme
LKDRAIFASGSPFPDYRTKDGRVLRPGQGNNAYIFPGLALGITCAGLIDISDDFMLLAAEVPTYAIQLTFSSFLFSCHRCYNNNYM